MIAFLLGLLLALATGTVQVVPPELAPDTRLALEWDCSPEWPDDEMCWLVITDDWRVETGP